MFLAPRGFPKKTASGPGRFPPNASRRFEALRRPSSVLRKRALAVKHTPMDLPQFFVVPIDEAGKDPQRAQTEIDSTAGPPDEAVGSNLSEKSASAVRRADL